VSPPSTEAPICAVARDGSEHAIASDGSALAEVMSDPDLS
jgi:hypothetical protein